MTAVGKNSAETVTSEKDRIPIEDAADFPPLWKKEEEWPNHMGFQRPLEEHDSTELQVFGQIPSYVAGVLYRTGPYAFQVEDTPTGTYSRSHWFDGFSQTHRFQIIPTSTGSVRILYSSRSQVDGLIEKIRKTGDFHTYTFAQKRDPCQSILGKLLSVFTPIEPGRADSASVPVCIRKSPKRGSEKNGTSLVLESDYSMTKELDLETLEPIGIANQSALHPLLKGPMSCAHSMTDPETGDIFNYNLDFGRYATYRVFRCNASSGTTDILATITGPNTFPAYLHSFFLTDDFVILCIWTSYIAAGGLKVLWEKNVLDAICPFDPAQKVRWLVVDRINGRGLVAEFESPAAFCFHTANAWQQPNPSGGEDIICNVLEYPDLDILHRFYYSNLIPSKQDKTPLVETRGRSSLPRLARYALRNLQPNSVTNNHTIPSPVPQAELLMTMPSPLIGDIPTFNSAYATKPNRYIYTIVDRGLSNFFDGISKADTLTQSAIYWDNPRGHTPGEAIFIPHPNGVEEDDGVLLSVVLDGFRQTSYLLCLDAKTMRELGRAECGCVVGLGFHGQHVKDDGSEGA